MGVIEGICISKERGTQKQAVNQADLQVKWGILGDAHGGNWHRQVSLLSYEKIEAFKMRGADVEFGAFGENLIVSGFDFSTFPVGTRFRCGEVLLEMTQIGKECHNHCQIYEKMGDCIMPREGVFAVVLEGGTIHKGDEMIQIPANLYRTIADRDASCDCVLATVLNGKLQGEKRLYIDGICRFGQRENSFLKEHEQALLAVTGNCILEFDKTQVFCEKIGSRKNLVICGAGHVSIPIIKLAQSLGFYITVIDDRPFFANNARRAEAEQVICDTFAAGLEQVAGSLDTYFVIVTRGHRYDIDCLRMAMGKPNAYIGMMGSKKRVRLVKEQLAGEGIPQALLEQVHTPIGLAIGAETPEEIAVSIMAEIIQEKNTGRKNSVYDKTLLSYLTGEMKMEGSSVLCTIVEKKGSAPREVGTKMLILEDGTIVGTIGGGCAESSVIQKGLHMLRSGQSALQLESVDMTGKEAEEAGMVCGGTILVLMEYVEHV